MKAEYTLAKNLKYVIDGMHKYGNKLISSQLISIIVDSLELFLVPVLVKLIIQQIENGKDTYSIIKLLGIYAVIIILVNLLQGIISNQLEWKMKYVLIRVKRNLMNTMLSMDYANLESPDVLDEHEKIRNVMNNKDAGIEGMMNSSVKCGKFLLQIIISAFIISKLSIWLTLIICTILVLAAVPIDRAKKKDKKEVWDALGPFWRRHFNLGFLTTHFDSAKEIRLYNMKDWIYRKYLGVNNDIQDKYVISRNIWHKCHCIVKTLELIQEIALYGFLIYEVFHGNLTIADFTLYIASVHIFTKAVNDFMNEFADIKKQSNDITDFRRFVDKYTRYYDDNDEIIDIKPDVTFENVSFKYQGQNKKALDNINIDIPYGQRLAVVGLNGAGKTTFIKLLCGLYEPSEGSIKIEKKNANEYSMQERSGLFSPVFQNVEVYPFTIAENISMRKKENTNIDRVNECLKKCGLFDKVQNFKYKENTQLLKVLDEDGIELSGGEKQKIAIARALYKDSPIIVLDEPTSALDPLAEEKLYRSFDELIKSKTGIYISHRLSSTRFCDKIAMFKEGRIVEYGTHDELMAIKGEYFEIYNSQAQYYKEG